VTAPRGVWLQKRRSWLQQACRVDSLRLAVREGDEQAVVEIMQLELLRSLIEARLALLVAA
jgi:hypothetical protein